MLSEKDNNLESNKISEGGKSQKDTSIKESDNLAQNWKRLNVTYDLHRHNKILCHHFLSGSAAPH